MGLALCVLIPSASATPRELKPRVTADKRTQRALPEDTLVERLVVKFHEGSHVRLRGGSLVPLASERSASERSLLTRAGLTDARLGADVRSVEALLERVPRLSAPRRLFLQEESALAALKASGEAREGQQLADLDLYYEVPLLPGSTAGSLASRVEALNALDSVELAYAEPPAEPAAVDIGMDPGVRALLTVADRASNTPMFESYQGYLGPAPVGVNARFAWTVPGGTGAGVRVVDVERAWQVTHEDMPHLFMELGSNDPSNDHGTAVMGEMVGMDNHYGVTGISHGAEAGVSSYLVQSVASAIASAASAVGPGGAVLIEIHARGPADSTPCTCNTGQCHYIAMEYWQDIYDVIAMATANGVTVVEAAGNGSANLDDPAYSGLFNRSVRDSGAILAGASTAYTRVPMCWTNFGSRVDLHGWGEQVTTMGYGYLFNASGKDSYYTNSFSGTSSASPIVTASAVVLQGVKHALGQPPLKPVELRSLLVATGSAQASNPRKIGPLPDLRNAIFHMLGFGRPRPGPIGTPVGTPIDSPVMP